MTRSEEGLPTEDNDGPLILSVDGVEVRESTWAGAYYCAHVLYVATRAARSTSTSIVRDSAGDPLVGFLHVPADAETGGSPGRARRERHANTARVVSCALAGIAEELRAVVANGDKARVLITGFGPFAAVVSNPTGDFVEHDESVASALAEATGARTVKIDDAIYEGGARIACHQSAHLVLGGLRLDVHDGALDPARPGSLPWAMARFAPHAVLALGVHRASSIYRVELEPTNAGLFLQGEAPRHERGRPLDARDPHNRALARAIARGAAKLGV